MPNNDKYGDWMVYPIVVKEQLVGLSQFGWYLDNETWTIWKEFTIDPNRPIVFQYRKYFGHLADRSEKWRKDLESLGFEFALEQLEDGTTATLAKDTPVIRTWRGVVSMDEEQPIVGITFGPPELYSIINVFTDADAIDANAPDIAYDLKRASITRTPISEFPALVKMAEEAEAMANAPVKEGAKA